MLMGEGIVVVGRRVGKRVLTEAREWGTVML